MFRLYITKDPTDDKRFLCLACKANGCTDFSSYYDFLSVHFNSSTRKHALFMAKEDKSDKTKTFTQKQDEIEKEVKSAIEAFNRFRARKKVKLVPKFVRNEMCVKYTGFLMQNQLPFSLIQNLCDFFKHLLQQYGPQAIQETSLSNVKAAQIAKECILKSFKDSIFEDLSKTPFALMFDESSDVFGSPYLCTHVRYIKDGKVRNRFLSLEQITEATTGESLLKIVKTKVFDSTTEMCLQKNLIGICSDRASNMISSKD